MHSFIMVSQCSQKSLLLRLLETVQTYSTIIQALAGVKYCFVLLLLSIIFCVTKGAHEITHS
jgi:membrane protein required for beta-lactamase induction